MFHQTFTFNKPLFKTRCNQNQTCKLDRVRIHRSSSSPSEESFSIVFQSQCILRFFYVVWTVLLSFWGIFPQYKVSEGFTPAQKYLGNARPFRSKRFEIHDNLWAHWGCLWSCREKNNNSWTDISIYKWS